MARFSVAVTDDAPVVTTPHQTTGAVETRAVVVGDGQPIHLHLHRLAPGATMTVTCRPTDHFIYVWEGAMEANDVQFGRRASAIVEYGASLTVTGGSDGAALLVFNRREREAGDRAGGHVHLLPAERVPQIEVDEINHLGMWWHADSHCPSCSLWFHENDYWDPDIETVPHSHSEDEIIFVRSGKIRLGARLYGPGTALAIHADTKYSFFSDPDELSYVNFRGSVPTYTSADGKVTFNEHDIWAKRM
jgi:hypothetical protein